MNFWEKYKKILMIVGLLFVTVAMGMALYFMFFRAESPTGSGKKASSTSDKVGGLSLSKEGQGNIVDDGNGGLAQGTDKEIPDENKPSEVASGGLTKISTIKKEPVDGMTAGGDGVQFYNRDDGKFYRINDKGEGIEEMSDKVFYDVKKVTWAPNKNKAILEYPDNSKIIYDFETKKQVTIPKHWQDFDFSKDSNQIIAKSIGLDPENRWLMVQNTDGTGVNAVEPIGDKGDQVYPAWSPNNQSVALYTEGIDLNRQKVYFVGLKGENFKATTIEGRGFQPIWAPDGEKLVYSVTSQAAGNRPELWVVNAKGDYIGTDRKNIGLQTWAKKCSFAKSGKLYCAVPKYIEEDAGAFYNDMIGQTEDDIYRVDVNTGTKKLIAIPAGKYSIDSLTVSDDEKFIFFNDHETKSINKISLQ